MSRIRNLGENEFTASVRFRDTYNSAAGNIDRTGRNESVKTDTVVLQQTSQAKKQVEELFGEFLKRLEKAYPELQIVVSDNRTGSEQDLLARTLQEMKDGYVLFLSRDFMESLSSGEETYRIKTRAVLDAVRRLGAYRDGAGVWLQEDAAVFLSRKPEEKKDNKSWIQDWCQRQEQQMSDMMPSPSEQEVFRSKAISTAYYQSATAYSRLARAKTKSSAQTVITEIRQSISSLKLLTAYGDDKMREKAKKAIKSLEKLLLRANRKIRRFDEERLTDIRRKKAQEKGEAERALQAALELKKRQTSRAIGDGAIRTEGRLNNIDIPGYRNRLRDDWIKRQYRTSYDDWVTSVPVNTTMAADMMLSAAEFASADVAAPEGFQIAEVMTF